jgi:hypothetical protein
MVVPHQYRCGEGKEAMHIMERDTTILERANGPWPVVASIAGVLLCVVLTFLLLY